MNTAFHLMAQHNGQGGIPADKVREYYLSQECQGMIGGLLCRIGWHGWKSPGGVFPGTDLKGVQ